MSERVVGANGIEIWTEDFGDPADPALLLVMGATAQGIAWPDEFCQQLADGGRHVIRYDNRDTGQSTCRDYATNPYTVSDMAADAVGVLDAYGIDAAHVAGASMGGMITQALAIEHPTRVITMTSIMSSPGGTATAAAIGGDASVATLPPPEPKVIEMLMSRMASPPTTREEQIEVGMLGARVLAGSLNDTTDEELRAAAGTRAGPGPGHRRGDEPRHGGCRLAGSCGRAGERKSARSSSTATRTRSSRTHTARRPPRPSPERRCSRSRAWVTTCPGRRGRRSSTRSSPTPPEDRACQPVRWRDAVEHDLGDAARHLRHQREHGSPLRMAHMAPSLLDCRNHIVGDLFPGYIGQ